MSDVALRCPKCGTTQNHTGECDACYGGQVRYFCSNHNLGLWLDEPVCKECGGKFGEAARLRPTPPPTPAPPPPTRPPRRTEFRGSRGAESPPTRSIRPSAPKATPAAPSLPSLKDFLTHLLLKRPARIVFKEEKGDERPPEVRRPRTMGCFIKLILVALMLLALALGVPFLFVAGALQHFL